MDRPRPKAHNNYLALHFRDSYWLCGMCSSKYPDSVLMCLLEKKDPILSRYF
ncbi:hypothetical protein GQ53DRAFT_744009, partial [Thozetella sp. PMI_491]